MNRLKAIKAAHSTAKQATTNHIDPGLRACEFTAIKNPSNITHLKYSLISAPHAKCTTYNHKLEYPVPDSILKGKCISSSSWFRLWPRICTRNYNPTRPV